MKRLLSAILACVVGLLLAFGNLQGIYPGNAANKALQLGPHPRLFISSLAQFDSIRDKIRSDPEINAWYQKIVRQGQAMLQQPPSQYELPDGVRLLPVSRRILDRVTVLAFLYRMEGNPQYAERVWIELQAAASFQTWHPEHFLDTAEMTYAFALGYDWLYDVWTPDQRTVIRDAIINKGLEPAVKVYEEMESNKGWPTSRYNWNLVCNGGIGLGVLAIGDEEPELAGFILPKVIQAVPNALSTYQPDGAWSEGLGYWHYGTSYLCWLLGGMQTALGTTYGLTNIGLENTGYFPIYLSGQGNNGFDFGDSGRGTMSGPELFWLARQYNKSEYATWRKRDLMTKAPTVWDILWYDPNFPGQSYSDLPLDRYFRGVEVAALRSTWLDTNGFYVAIKGFTGERNHTDLDSGDFVLEAKGVQWIEELGPDNYNLSGYWDMKKPSLGRWKYYRKRAEGQNTLTIGSMEGPDQNPDGVCPIIRFQSSTDEASAIVDLTAAYFPNARNIQRGIKLFESRKKVLLQDEIQLLQPNDIWWFVHTRQKINVSVDGKSVQLISGSKRLQISLLSPTKEDARFVVLDAIPLPTSPHPSEQGQNMDFKKLAIHFSAQEKVTIAVLFQLDDHPKERLYQTIPLKDW